MYFVVQLKVREFTFMIRETSIEFNLLLNEAGLASTMLGEGLTVLRKADFVRKWNYYQAFFLISIGLERMLKLIIVSKYLTDNGSFPSNEFLKVIGHDIRRLIKEVENYHIDSDNFSAEVDKMIISFFTNFDKKTRYYNLDTITGAMGGSDPLSEWHDIQTKIKSLVNIQSTFNLY
jgi:hypothetical protein